MSAIARESFAQLLQEIDHQEHEQQQQIDNHHLQRRRKDAVAGTPMLSPNSFCRGGLGSDPTSFASLAWGLHRAGHCKPVLLDAIALLLPQSSLSGLDPVAALRLLEATCQTACSR